MAWGVSLSSFRGVRRLKGHLWEGALECFVRLVSELGSMEFCCLTAALRQGHKLKLAAASLSFGEKCRVGG